LTSPSVGLVDRHRADRLSPFGGGAGREPVHGTA